MNRIKFVKSRCAIILFCAYMIINADLKMVITPETQPGDYVCWVCCTDMTLIYYGNKPSLHYHWLRGSDGQDVINGIGNPNSWHPHPKVKLNVKELLELGNTVNVPSTWHSGTILWNDLKNNVTAKKPMIAGLKHENREDFGHVVLVIGYTNDNKVFFNDPKVGIERKLPYTEFCDNDVFYWAENLVPNSGSPGGQVPVLPICPYITTPSGPSQFNYPGSVVTYSSDFPCTEGMPPYQWTWKLVFFHMSGEYCAGTHITYGMGSSTWNIPAFVLPTGYCWLYTMEGLVRGTIQVTTEPGYSAWKEVTYAPQTIIPAHISFTNQSVSGSHPNVDAHYCVDINNVTVNSGASISFNAGSCFQIDNLTVNNNSAVTFRIDPSLQ